MVHKLEQDAAHSKTADGVVTVASDLGVTERRLMDAVAATGKTLNELITSHLRTGKK